MKILQIICTFPPYKGGMGNVALMYAKAWSKENEVVTVTTAYDDKPSIKHHDYGIVQSLRPVLKYGNGAFLPQLFLLLKKHDIIFLHYPFFGAAETVWLFCALFSKKKLIIHYHMDVEQSGWITKILSIPSLLIRTSLFRRADLISCASLDYIYRSQIKNVHEKYPEKFKEIPFGVDIEKFHPLHGEIGNSEELKLLFVGGLDRAHYFKGLEILLDSLTKLKNKKWKLDIIGDGDMRQYYELQVKKTEIYEQVRFLGKLDDETLARKYREHDVLILPSINGNEAFGLVILEALASGLAIIASSLPGVRKVFTDEVEGYLVEPQNASELTSAINKFIQDNELLIDMKTNARLLAETKYDIRNMNSELLKLIKITK